MIKKEHILLTLIIVLFILNCSGKNGNPQVIKPYSTPIIINNPPKRVYTTPRTIPPEVKNQELLGVAIKKIPSVPAPVTPEEEIKNIPNHQNSIVQGTTTLSTKFKLPHKLKESSALIKVDGMLWTLNDSGGKAKLYQISEKDGHIIKTLKIKHAHNRDWEALTYDDKYVYIGDFGNNRGNRKDLKIYKISRKALKNKRKAKAKIIHFRYSDQKNFHSRKRKHNFDCEAMIAYHGKLYLFSKDWKDNKTRLYELSTKAGKQIAHYRDDFNVQGLVTDASINKELDILILSTYSKLLTVSIWAFANFEHENFFKGTSKKLTLNSLTAQVEGITFIDKYRAYLSSESFSKYIFSFDASLYEIDFSREFQ